MILKRSAEDSVSVEDELLSEKMSLLRSCRGSENFRFISSLPSAGLKGPITTTLRTQEFTNRSDSRCCELPFPSDLQDCSTGHLPVFQNFATRASSFNRQTSRAQDEKELDSGFSLVKAFDGDLSEELRQARPPSIQLGEIPPSQISLHPSISEATGRVLYCQLRSAVCPL